MSLGTEEVSQPLKGCPKPNDDESKEQFVDRCISTLCEANPDLSKEQASQSCYLSWNSSKNARSLFDEVTERIKSVRDFLVKILGKRGETLLNYTLVRLGVYDPSMKNFNMAALSDNMNLPFLKYEEDGSVIVGNLMSPPVMFTKIDKEAKTVEGYANTITIDTYSDVFLPEAYKDSFIAEYQGKKNRPIFFMHHLDVPAGDLLDIKFDNIGMYVKTKPYTAYWDLIENGTLKGFSIGFYFKIWPDQVGMAWVTHKKHSIYGNDISYVTSPANLLSYFTDVPEEASKQRINEFVADPKRPMKNKTLLNAIKDESTDQIAIPSTASGLIALIGLQSREENPKTAQASDTGLNKNFKETRKLTEETTQQTQPTEKKQFVEKTTEELMNMTPMEQMKYMEELAEHRFKIKNIENIRAAEDSVKELRKQDESKEVNNKFGQLFAKIDEFGKQLASITAKLAIHDEKFVKIDETVEDVQVTAPTATNKSLTDLASKSMNFDDFHAKASEVAPQ